MKIILLCALGMSTSLLVKKMNREAASQSIDATIEAYSADDLEEQLENADIILLGPQIRYKKRKIFQQAEEAGVPIDVIDMKAYGVLDEKKVLKQALSLKNKQGREGQ
ncbi:PTS sugar transporter subunit IIB [Oceanobacillus oncorhynchi subsp. incaldanensis]|uniref:Lichenan-specific phosphotransferase enzyme IIB component n=1 Tax=Oceanobacillus oncorhynchi TaxID=545501 RepID=A0A0A1MFS2_9BACI|nr:PTS sugar transporter subunit IIB [Oceanobacillus oncorhynchi]GIO18555.1 PTS sugar transporter subunit IIB [Oceanobacillus oncorhynchi subsp. incaldanensis]CEI81933.1 Lichenan-specific phosphotransferase enzyme IIB component [Oceanobacillus oncorhynchi]